MPEATADSSVARPGSQLALQDLLESSTNRPWPLDSSDEYIIDTVYWLLKETVSKKSGKVIIRAQNCSAVRR